MKKNIFYLLPLCLLLCGCPGVEIEPFATQYTPVLIDRGDLKASIRFEPPSPLGTLVSFARYQDLILAAEATEGIHIIDNSDSTNPIGLGFLKVIGATDISVKDDLLYVNNALDMVSIDISNPSQPIEVHRIEEAFEVPNPPDLGTIPEAFQPEFYPKNAVFVKWEKQEENE